LRIELRTLDYKSSVLNIELAIIKQTEENKLVNESGLTTYLSELRINIERKQ
jgi:hypothetical protein